MQREKRKVRKTHRGESKSKARAGTKAEPEQTRQTGKKTGQTGHTGQMQREKRKVRKAHRGKAKAKPEPETSPDVKFYPKNVEALAFDVPKFQEFSQTS